MSRLSNPYKLEGLRAILAVAPSAVAIVRQVEYLELAVENSSAEAFDFADGLICTICRTVMADRGHVFAGRRVTPQMFRETIARLPLVPANHPNQAQARD